MKIDNLFNCSGREIRPENIDTQEVLRSAWKANI